MMVEWEKLKTRNPKAKLVCIDIVPNVSTQAPDRKDSPQQIKVLLRHDGTAFRTETRSSRLSSRSFNSPVSGSRADRERIPA